MRLRRLVKMSRPFVGAEPVMEQRLAKAELAAEEKKAGLRPRMAAWAEKIGRKVKALRRR